MAITPGPVGATTIAGFRTHTNDWNSSNTGAALTTGDAFEMRLEGVPKPKPIYSENVGVVGGVGLQRMGLTLSKYELSGDIKVNGLFACNALSRMIACWFGAETTTSLGGSPTAYSHLFTIATNSAFVGNWAYVENLLAHDSPMTKAQSLGFDWEPGMQPVITVGLVADTLQDVPLASPLVGQEHQVYFRDTHFILQRTTLVQA